MPKIDRDPMRHYVSQLVKEAVNGIGETKLFPYAFDETLFDRIHRNND